MCFQFTHFPVMIERIYILCLVIIIKLEVWTITHCLGLGHETMVCTVCLSIFLLYRLIFLFIQYFARNWPWYSLRGLHIRITWFSLYSIRIPLFSFKAKPHGCCIFSMILHEAPSMETTTPKGKWFPCSVAEWSIMENMQQQMWFCFYPSPISINISIYVYNALRLTPQIWFWAMPFASFQIDINKYFAIVSARCQVISNCDVMSPWVTWQNNRLMISRFAILSREYLLQTALCNQ